MNQLSDLLLAYRVLALMSMGEAAEACGVSNTTYGDWEHGRLIPQIDRRQKICKALNIPEAEFNHCYMAAVKWLRANKEAASGTSA